MQHLDPDRLVLLALSEETESPLDFDHLAECAVCRHELYALRTVADLGTESQDLRDLPPPPERIWQSIEVGIGQAPVPAVPERRSRPRPRWLLPVLAAAAAAVLAVAGTVVVDRLAHRAPPERVTARATLSPLPSVPAAAGGSVRVLAAGEMRVDVRNLPLTTGFHEVWLIDPDDLTKMVAVGNLSDKPDVVLTVPPGIDLNRYRLVDISDEPHDGDAAHSGRSLLRGTLTY
ncbi:Anti-sigma-K factor rskA [Asanoa hainanensis]|uniref:Anti-sigma-K factor rskA n=1 Tax=Asanoa hainanensis TaxID=560556 RepID=A0A239N5F3_9ACTN|nr:anti-sigma factor [Asanoa hainanensis]SNT49409.1 Anti-sigma-K factor rskA [Asanoa hainanensis]